MQSVKSVASAKATELPGLLGSFGREKHILHQIYTRLINIQSNFNGLNKFGTTKISSR